MQASSAPATILVTGAAGFIGAAVSESLLAAGHRVVGVDNLNDYYSPILKDARLQRLRQDSNFTFAKIDIADTPAMAELFDSVRPSHVVHLAAQAGVRYSIENPMAYVQSNLVGHMNILEGCRRLQAAGQLQHVVYASSSSVYGGNAKTPFSETDRVDNPVSLYAATKKADELLTESYSHLYEIPASGLRFFTVYGPWGRPDMAPMLFADAMTNGRPIKVFNNGDMQRDFTYIDDIVRGVVALLFMPLSNRKTHEIYNIGNSQSVRLMTFIETMEQALGVTAEKIMLPMQPGDVYQTYADTSKLEAATGFRPNTPLSDGIAAFAAWYQGPWHHQRQPKHASRS